MPPTPLAPWFVVNFCQASGHFRCALAGFGAIRVIGLPVWLLVARLPAMRVYMLFRLAAFSAYRVQRVNWFESDIRNFGFRVKSYNVLQVNRVSTWNAFVFSCGARIFIWRLQPMQWSEDASPQWVQGRSPGRGSGTSTEAEAVGRHCLQILTAETIKIWKSRHNSPPDSWPICFTLGAKRHFGRHSPLAHVWRRPSSFYGISKRV